MLLQRKNLTILEMIYLLQLISNSCICDVERKGCKKDNNNKKYSGLKRKGRKKDNNKKEDSDDRKNANINNDKDNDKDNDNDNDKVDNDNDNLIDKLLSNKDKLHNFSDKLLNNLINFAKLKEKILMNRKKVGEIFNKINIPKKDIRSKLDKYKKINILYDDLVNHVWGIIYGKNRVNNEIDNIDCDRDEDIKRYTDKYIKIVSDKQILIYSVSESIDELMEGLDVNTSNVITTKEIKDFKRVVIESIEKFISYIKLETKKEDIEKKDIEKKDIKKKDTAKEHIEKINTKKNSIEHDANNKPATSADIKTHIIDKQKLIKQRYKSLLETKKTFKDNIELIYSALKKLPNE